MSKEAKSKPRQVHPAAALWPMLQGEGMEVLIESMKTHGFDPKKPILLYQGKVIDGRNRQAAAKAAGIKPIYQNVAASKNYNPWLDSWKHNGARRDVEPDQKAAIHFELIEKAGLEFGKQGKKASAETFTLPKIAEASGVSRMTVARVAAIKKNSPAKFKEVLRGKTRANEVYTEQRRKARMGKIKEAAKGNKKLETAETYPVIYCDPPWQFDNPVDETRKLKYATMSPEELAKLPVAKLASADAVLFLWATGAHLKEALALLETWGFEYRSNLVWAKDRAGLGFWARGKHEHLLIAVRGSVPTPKPANRPESVINAPRGEHSAKPEIFAKIIERMFPELQKIELFARKSRKGWAVWGNEVKESPAELVEREEKEHSAKVKTKRAAKEKENENPDEGLETFDTTSGKFVPVEAQSGPTAEAT